MSRKPARTFCTFKLDFLENYEKSKTTFAIGISYVSWYHGYNEEILKLGFVRKIFWEFPRDFEEMFRCFQNFPHGVRFSILQFFCNTFSLMFHFYFFFLLGFVRNWEKISETWQISTKSCFSLACSNFWRVMTGFEKNSL